MTHGFNPVYSNPDGAMNADLFKDETLVPFHVAVTPFINDTAVYADIILPETTYLEDWEIETRPSVEQVPFVSLRQPVVPALESAKTFFEIATELANRARGGAEQFFAFKSVSDYLKARIGGIDGLVRAGGVDYLKQHGVWYDPKSRPNYGSYQGGGFATPSGRIEVSSQAVAAKNQPALPSYLPVASFRDMAEHDLVLVIYQTAIQSDGTGNCMWLNEIQHHNPAMINPETAARLGIKDGDKIKITRKNGGETRERSIESEAFVSEGVHTGVIAMAGGVGHEHFGRIAAGEKFSKDEIDFNYLKDANVELIWWGHHNGSGVNPKRIVPVISDPVGGGQAWGDVVVQVGRV
jgi:anaerobic selenocysteine-containing dehydrogenase